mmetsp:Transcript_1155/g.3561  ORF Transcript_1155/g.3561 Transcript_1155/m.3561 type:complete len:224 (-) Transcript_1155:535-1206(-)
MSGRTKVPAASDSSTTRMLCDMAKRNRYDRSHVAERRVNMAPSRPVKAMTTSSTVVGPAPTPGTRLPDASAEERSRKAVRHTLGGSRSSCTARDEVAASGGASSGPRRAKPASNCRLDTATSSLKRACRTRAPWHRARPAPKKAWQARYGLLSVVCRVPSRLWLLRNGARSFHSWFIRASAHLAAALTAPKARRTARVVAHTPTMDASNPRARTAAASARSMC